MPEFLIAFNDEWTGDLDDDDLRERGRAVRQLRQEMGEAGVLLFTGGLDVVDRIGKLGDSSEQPTQVVEIEQATVTES